MRWSVLFCCPDKARSSYSKISKAWPANIIPLPSIIILFLQTASVYPILFAFKSCTDAIVFSFLNRIDVNGKLNDSARSNELKKILCLLNIKNFMLKSQTDRILCWKKLHVCTIWKICTKKIKLTKQLKN